ncbi:hypothetical protein GRI89_00085 [Altererythrobacter salegens]|uniref:Uncharacterized protein n=1 Tax=Croceibacterium salegens TaxID=1737568 RepID=A0A6I4SSK1_9SPHN|nr:hypothetical protein [Croceibacterium salegens]MXO57946.1 hypothetical protein [Croceibacterium salegens]
MTEEAPQSSGSWRGPLQIYCPKCKEFQRARSLRIPRPLGEGKRKWFFVKEPDIAWFRRKRHCTKCGKEFLTGEVNEELIEELLRLRQREKKRKVSSYTKASRDVRSGRKWLRTKGDDIPLELCRELVAGSAWWLTHSSGSPVHAPRHADRLQKRYCGYCVKFGANSFAAGRALAKARDYAVTVFEQAAEGNLPSERKIRQRLRAIPSDCVLNVNLDFYDHYPTNGVGELVFGAQAIDVNDCERILMRVTGLEDLIAEHKRIDKED